MLLTMWGLYGKFLIIITQDGQKGLRDGATITFATYQDTPVLGNVVTCVLSDSNSRLF